MIDQMAFWTCAWHGPKCGIILLCWPTQWLNQCIWHWQYSCSFGYWKSLVAGYKHTHTKARVGIINMQAGKIVGRRMKVCRSHELVMRFWVVLGKVVCLVGVTWLLKDVLLTLANLVLYPIKLHANDLEHFCLMLLLAIPVAVVLSV